MSVFNDFPGLENLEKKFKFKDQQEPWTMLPAYDRNTKILDNNNMTTSNCASAKT